MTSYIGWIIGAIILFVMLSTRNLFKDMIAIISKTIQETIKLGITVISFFFRIVSVAELYIVLLIDIFAGNLKQSAVTRLLSVAVVMLSVASFYTTYSGMGYLIEGEVSPLIRLCVTFGIQAIMLGASLKIGKCSIVRVSGAADVAAPPLLPDGIGLGKWGIGLRVAAVVLAGTVYGLVYFLDLGGKWENFLYMLGCFLLIGCLCSLLPYIFTESHRGALSTTLLIVYFATLSVSSFFSYHTLLNTLYREEERKIDNIVIVAEEVSNLVEDSKGCFDKGYQVEVQKRLMNAADSLRKEATLEAFHGSADMQRIVESETFETNYTTLQRIVPEYHKAKAEIEAEAEIETEAEAEEKKTPRMMEIEYYVRSELGPKFEAEIGVTPGIQSFLEILEYDAAKKVCMEGINILLTNLQKLEWDAAEAAASEAALEDILAFMNRYILAEDRDALDPNLRELGELLETTSAWKRFLYSAKSLQQEILSLDTSSDTLDWNKSIQTLSKEVQELLNGVPPYFQVFPSGDGEPPLESVGQQISAAELSLQLQRTVRDHRPGLNKIEQNLRAFVEAPQLSLFAALIAVLMDTLILFVGMLLPRMIQYFKDTKAYGAGAKYDPEEIEEVLDNTFNKPVQERDE